MPQERRSYSKSFKAQVIAECAQPDTSLANVALTHNLNANLVHKWIRVHARKNLTLQPEPILSGSAVPTDAVATGQFHLLAVSAVSHAIF
ncbi:transposase [Pseudomonas petroselini]|uniref:transposase n=1 Tax=Pseudomonas petroselini TaxID=2899822 RepID=UPI00386D6FF9